jgi:tetratricopeptide (TPR) repeat protein
MIDKLKFLILALAVLGLLAGCSSRSGSPFPKTSSVPSSSRTGVMSSEIERLNILVSREEDPLRRSGDLIMLGSLYTMAGELPAAWDAYEQSRTLRVEIGDDELILESSRFLASMLASKNRQKKALELLERDLAREGLPVAAREDAGLNELLAMLYIDTRQFTKAASSARIAAEGFRRQNLREKAAEVIYHEAIALWELNERDRAEELLRESFDYFHRYAVAYDSSRHRNMVRLQRNTARKWGVSTTGWDSE